MSAEASPIRCKLFSSANTAAIAKNWNTGTSPTSGCEIQSYSRIIGPMSFMPASHASAAGGGGVGDMKTKPLRGGGEGEGFIFFLHALVWDVRIGGRARAMP